MYSNLKGVAEICKPKKYKITGLHDDDDDDELIVVTQRRTKPTSIRALDYMLGIYGVVSRLARAHCRRKFSGKHFLAVSSRVPTRPRSMQRELSMYYEVG